VTSASCGIHRLQLRGYAATTNLSEAARSRDGYEIGGILVGRLHNGGMTEIRHAGNPGPVAVRQPTFFLRDLDHAQRLAEKGAHPRGLHLDRRVADPPRRRLNAQRPRPGHLRPAARDTTCSSRPSCRSSSLGRGDWTEPDAYAHYADRAEAVPLLVDHPANQDLTPLMKDNR
jgi:hypothetical protein